MFYRLRSRAYAYLLVSPLAMPILAMLVTLLVIGWPHLVHAADPVASVGVSVGNAPVDEKGVVIPWGSWVSSGLAWVSTAVFTIVSALVARFFKNQTQQKQIDQVLQRAVDYGFGAIQGLVKDKQVSLPQTSAWLTAAEKYVISITPSLANSLGDKLRAMLFARLSALHIIDPEVIPEQVNATLPGQVITQPHT